MAQDGIGIALAEKVDDFGVAGCRGEHQGGLVRIVESWGPAGFVAEVDEEFDDREVAELGGEVKVGIGVAGGRVVGVVEEMGVGFEDAGDEGGVVEADCAAESEGGVDPTQRVR